MFLFNGKPMYLICLLNIRRLGGCDVDLIVVWGVAGDVGCVGEGGGGRGEGAD